jgi:hypothetical protein
MEWSKEFFNEPISSDILIASEFFKNNSEIGDSIGMPEIFLSGMTNPLIKIMSFSTVPAFVVRPENKSFGCIRSVIDERLVILRNIEDAKDFNAAKEILNNNRIRWFITFKSHPLAWDRKYSNASIIGDMLIYDSGHSTQLSNIIPKCNLF